eukprot:m.133243 g.133243  ORF g.133243 m.133243 type:complete len:644 (-) comp14667_c0_seq7:154-2085(-)
MWQLLFCACILPCIAQDGLNPGGIFPPPNSDVGQSGQWVVDPTTFKISIGQMPSTANESKSRLQRGIQRFQDFVFDFGPAAPINSAQCWGQPGRVGNGTCTPLNSLVINVDSASDVLDRFTNESYTLAVTMTAPADTAILNATTIYGALRGLQTFSQMVKFNLSSATYTIFGSIVSDAPRFEYRGVMIDTSRNFVSLNTLRLICDQMEQNKMNALHLHLTDDQSWPITIEGMPLLTQWMAYGNQKYDSVNNQTTSHIYSLANMSDFVGYCWDRAVRVIPEVDLPGHCIGQNAYPEYFVPQDSPHNCNPNITVSSPGNVACDRGLIDVTSEKGFDFVQQLYSSLVKTFPQGEYHIGGDEVWSVPWSNSTIVQSFCKQHAKACPDDPNITCGSIGDLQPYFTRRVVEIINNLKPGAQLQGWAPGVEGFYQYGNLGSRYPNFTYSNWNGWDGWQGPMSRMTDESQENASVILSGPFYINRPVRTVVDSKGNVQEQGNWEQMMHTAILNFTGGDKSKVRGAELVAWGDSTGIDSGGALDIMAIYMSGMAINLWSKNGTVSYVNPDGFSSCNGDDYSICDSIDWHRCRTLMRGIPYGQRARHFDVPCAVAYEPRAPGVWYKSPKLPAEDSVADKLRQQLREAGLEPVA